MTEMTLEQRRAIAIATASAKAGGGAPAGPTPKPFGVLPFSEDRQGNVSFDSNAGLLGIIKDAFTLPYDVRRGEIDPTSDEGSRRALEAALLMTPLSAASRVGGALAPKTAFRQPKTAAPTREELRVATDAAYKRVEDLDVSYTSGAIEKMVRDLEIILDKQGSFRGMEGVDDVYVVLAKLKDELISGPIGLQRLDKVFRQSLSDIAASPKEQVRRAAATAIKELDKFIASPNARNSVSGTGDLSFAAIVANMIRGKEASEALLEARGNAAAGFRSDRVTGLQQTSQRRTAAANSGRNADNNIRQRLTSFIESKKGSRGLTEGEKQAIDDIIYGRPLKEGYRYIGNLLGGGGGVGTTLLSTAAGLGGAATLGPVGLGLALVPPVIGVSARNLANMTSRRELSMLDELMRSRSPLASSTPRPMPVYQPGIVQGGVELGGRGLVAGQLPPYNSAPRPMPVYEPGAVQAVAEPGAANQLPVYQPPPKPGRESRRPRGGMSEEMKWVLAHPGGV
jgi:hypothetical protein